MTIKEITVRLSEKTLAEFEIRLKELYERYRRAECSFGYLAQAMGMTTWELTYLLEERGRPAHNLPS